MHAVVVDPSRVVLELITRLLARRGDSASGFTRGDDALDKIKRDPTVDTLITSLEILPMSGLELCWEARLAVPPRRPLYIIVMSSLIDRDKLAEALDCGADEMIAKPVNPLELNARLRMAGRLKAAQLHLVRLAETDPLTGLYNRRAFFERLNACIYNPVGPTWLHAALLDIDHFKSVNDRFGHDVGDLVIKRVADEVAEASVLAGRLGGEEYGIIFQDASEGDVLASCKKLRQDCAEIPFKAGRNTFSVTCTIGVSRWVAGQTPDELLKIADVALYRAKKEGRNRVQLAA
jgi:two-component system, cell cycle response regulator